MDIGKYVGKYVGRRIHPLRQQWQQYAGFTLIELLIAVAIAAILAAIAYPAYLDAVRKAWRAEGRAAVAGVVQQQERYLTQTNTYLEFPAGKQDVPFKVYSSDDARNSHYDIGAEPCPATAGQAAPTLRDCIRVFAVPRGHDPEAGTLQLTSLGIRSCTGRRPAACW